jgi:hypothetical protein
MRLSLAAAACVVSMALLAGCSSQSQGPGALPAAGSSQSVHHGGVQFTGIPQLPKPHMSVKEILQSMIDGKIVPAIPRDALQRQLAFLNNPHHIRHDKKGGGGAAIWSNESFEDTIQGVNKTGTANAGPTIDTDENNDCENSFDLKVDGKRNVWTTCYETIVGSVASEGGAGEWNKSGNAVGTYQGGCPSNISPSECQDWESFPNSVAFSKSDVFVSDEYFYSFYNSYEDYIFGTGYAYWPLGDTSAQSTIINVYEVPFACGATDTDTCVVFDTGYVDVDNSGNLWGYAYGENETTGTEGTGIIEITSPTSSPKISNPLAFGSEDGWNYGYWGEAYISNKGKVLNAVDPYNATVLRWSLPDLTPMSSLGGGASDGWCEPVLGGFSKGDKDVAISDGCYSDQLDFAVVKTNQDTNGQDSSIDDNYGDGAAYAHSDK